jgi:VanZ family protein
MIAILHFVKKYYRTIIVSLLIIYLSTVSGEKVSKVSWFTFPHIDKIVHLLMYLTLSITVSYEIVRNKEKISVQKTLIIIVLFAILFGGAMELVQEYFTTTRSGDWADFGFNVIGASLCIPFFLIYNRNLNKKHLK